MKNEEIPPESADAPIPREDQNQERIFDSKRDRFFSGCFKNYPWTPKPWKMKVLNFQYMGYNP